MEVKLFLAEYVQVVHEFELGRLPKDLNPIELEMLSWEKPWRKESLSHYSQLGWSFVAVDNEQIVGYILAQPFLFFNNWTQSLWVETLSFSNEKVGYDLMDVIIRWAKTKHLQKVLLNNQMDNFDFITSQFKDFKQNSYMHLSTTKMSED